MVDTVALIDIKGMPIKEQFPLIETLTAMVRNGEIAIAKQVTNEAASVRHPDLAGAWLAGIGDQTLHATEPDLATLKSVMERHGESLVDPDAEREQADPYVLALALDLGATLLDETTVVTHDGALRDACLAEGQAVVDLATFVGEIGDRGS